MALSVGSITPKDPPFFIAKPSKVIFGKSLRFEFRKRPVKLRALKHERKVSVHSLAGYFVVRTINNDSAIVPCTPQLATFVYERVDRYSDE